MLIACEKCATTYVLDERLIPAAGAPVQCTRCSHVFLAKPGAAAPTAAPSALTADTPAPRSTQMFGAGTTPASKPTNQTMMFGAAGDAPPPAQPNRTVIFGAGNAPAPVKAPPRPAAAPAAQPTSRTMVFGAPSAPGTANPPPAAAAPNRTMMFGAVGGPPAPAPAPAQSKAMTFGFPGADKPSAEPLAAANSRTMMFGIPTADKPRVEPAAPAGANNRTMMFGIPTADKPSVEPAAPAGANNRTMMFGIPTADKPNVEPAAPAGASNRTMMFGIPTADKPNVEPAAPPGASNRTMMFGIPTADKPNVEPLPHPPAREGMVFGAAEAAGNPGKLTERTVRIGIEDIERMRSEHNARGSGPLRAVDLTPPEGAPGVSQRTQMFAMSEIRPPGEAVTPSDGIGAVESSDAVQARHDRTAMFAMTPESPRSGPPQPIEGEPLIASAELPQAEKSNLRFDPSLMETLPPGNTDEPPAVRATMIFGGAMSPPPVLLSPMERATAPDLVATTMPNLPPLPREAPQQLEGGSEDQVHEPAGAAADDGLENLQKQVTRRNRIALFVVLFAVVAALGAVGWKLFGAKLLGLGVPLEAMQGVESGLAELRKDDTASKGKAVAALIAVVKKHPAYVDGHAGLVTALTLQLDDLQQRAKRLDKAAEERNARISRFNKEKPAEWDTKAAALAAEVGAIKKDYDPLVAAARELEGRLREAYKAMQVAASQGGELNLQGELALIRAQALYHAYAGSEEALKASKRYQAKADTKSDGWIELVDAEYAANTRASPELVAEAQKQLTELHKRDSTFLRTYVLAARLHLQAKAYDEAEAELATVSALKPQHDVANELTAWIAKIKADKAAKKE